MGLFVLSLTHTAVLWRSAKTLLGVNTRGQRRRKLRDEPSCKENHGEERGGLHLGN